MAYTALYRKLRPEIFEDIIGQDHIVKTLQNQINNNRISHAYLFCGTRGTGKTSTAKVFSKAINCHNLVNGEPCNSCESCLSLKYGQNLDIIEIDAASNNGVDNIREIREEVNYTPTFGKYKVYIIDEVHMLSSGAFNALLKTLEEPPSHVIFILATTDPQKLPPTILSRCQRFDFRRITSEIMAETILKYMNAEDEKITLEAVKYICFLSDGAMRDALSILDQAMAFYYGEEIDLPKILNLVGSVDKQIFFDLTNCLFTLDTLGCIKIIDEMISAGRDIVQFSTELIEHFRDLMILSSIDLDSSPLNYSKEYLEKLKLQSSKININILIEYINIFSELQIDLKYGKNKKIMLETTCIKICNLASNKSLAGVFAKIEKLEKAINERPVQTQKIVEVSSEKKSRPVSFVKLEKAIPDDIKKVHNEWDIILREINIDKGLKVFLTQAKLGYIDNNILNIIFETSLGDKLLNTILEPLKKLLSSKYNKEFNIKISDSHEYNNHHLEKYGFNDEYLIKASKAHEDKFSENGIIPEINDEI